jgi:hypothetical protein
LTEDVDFTDYLARCMGLIDQFGWMVQGVVPNTNDLLTDPANSFPCAYTAGLTAKRLPELIVAGLPQDVAVEILNDAAARVVADGFVMAGEDYSDILEGYACRFVPTDTVRLSVARRLYLNVTAMQLLWPDNAARFPGEPDFQAELRAVQPILTDVPY